MPYNLDTSRFQIPLILMLKLHMGLLTSGTFNYTSLWHLSYFFLIIFYFILNLLTPQAFYPSPEQEANSSREPIHIIL